jgi:hypothetical protein
LLEEPENGETGLFPYVPLQLLHLRLDYQVNRFMGCDCHIERVVGWYKEYRALGTRYEKLAVNYVALWIVALIDKLVHKYPQWLQPELSERA